METGVFQYPVKSLLSILWGIYPKVEELDPLVPWTLLRPMGTYTGAEWLGNLLGLDKRRGRVNGAQVPRATLTPWASPVPQDASALLECADMTVLAASHLQGPRDTTHPKTHPDCAPDFRYHPTFERSLFLFCCSHFL